MLHFILECHVQGVKIKKKKIAEGTVRSIASFSIPCFPLLLLVRMMCETGHGRMNSIKGVDMIHVDFRCVLCEWEFLRSPYYGFDMVFCFLLFAGGDVRLAFRLSVV